MKIDKTLQKELEKHIKERAKLIGYKKMNGFLFSRIEDDLISVTYVIVNSTKLVYTVKIKKFTYDDIFWDTINMPENKKQPISLRINGAFKAPSIIISIGEITLTTDVLSVATRFCTTVVNEVTEFRKKSNVNNYVVENTTIPYSSTLKCLAYIDAKRPDLAVEIAKAKIEAGDLRGGFENEGKGFFEWIILQHGNA